MEWSTSRIDQYLQIVSLAHAFVSPDAMIALRGCHFNGSSFAPPHRCTGAARLQQTRTALLSFGAAEWLKSQRIFKRMSSFFCFCESPAFDRYAMSFCTCSRTLAVLGGVPKRLRSGNTHLENGSIHAR